MDFVQIISLSRDVEPANLWQNLFFLQTICFCHSDGEKKL